MVKQKILVFGYWENNLGDDLFLKIFSERYPYSKIYILTKKKYKHIYLTDNIRIIVCDSFFYRALNKVLKIFKLPNPYCIFLSRKVDAIVCLGGSLFMETNDWKTQIRNLDYVITNCENSFVIGSNFGPYHSKEYLQAYCELFAKMSSICLRDKSSYNLFSKFTNTRFAPDVVLNLKYKGEVQLQLNFNHYYVISVINLESRGELHKYKDVYERKIAEIVSEIINNGSSVVLMSFCDKEGDLDSALKIQSLLKNKSDHVLIYSHHQIDKSLNIISMANGIVATRFHAMILGFLYNKPVFPIVYSDKMRNVIKDYSFNNEYSSIEDIKKLCAKDVFMYLQKKPNIPLNIIKLAKEQFTDLDNMLN